VDFAQSSFFSPGNGLSKKSICFRNFGTLGSVFCKKINQKFGIKKTALNPSPRTFAQLKMLIIILNPIALPTIQLLHTSI